MSGKTPVEGSVRGSDPWLQMLIERRRWPVPSTKWWVLQELADLLLLSEKTPEVETHLQLAMASCEFESEVLEVLTAFWLARQQGHRVRVDLASVDCPHSCLSDMLLEEIQPGAVLRLSRAGQMLAPIGYQPSVGFGKVHGASVGRVFLSNMKRLEAQTGLPFVTQYGFEWDRSLQRVSVQADDWRFFYGPRWQELTGQFFTQSSHRARSAYIRTLDIAQTLWSMPERVARSIGAIALPFDPALAWLRPRVPAWLPKWRQGNQPSEQASSDFLRTCIQQVKVMEASSSLGHVSVVVPVKKLEWLELKCVLVAPKRCDRDKLQVEPAATGDGKGLSPEVEYKFEESGKPADGPVPALVRAFSERYGVLHTDVEQHGLFVPVPADGGGRLKGRPKEHQIELLVDETSVGFVMYWNSQWEPAHPRDSSPLCGTATVLLDSGRNLLRAADTTAPEYAFTAKWIKLGESFEKAVTEEWAGQIVVT